MHFAIRFMLFKRFIMKNYLNCNYNYKNNIFAPFALQFTSYVLDLINTLKIWNTQIDEINNSTCYQKKTGKKDAFLKENNIKSSNKLVFL